jgi:hypothetical protein
LNFVYGIAGGPYPLLLGLIAGTVTIVVLSVRRAIEGRAGLDLADLATAAIVGIAVGLVPVISLFAASRAIRGQAKTWTRFAVPPPNEAAAPSDPPARPGTAQRPAASPATRTQGGFERFDKFSDRARKVLTLAQDEALRFDHNYIGTEHLLLGLVREGEGVAARVLTGTGIELQKVRTAVEYIIGRGDKPVVGEVGLTPRAKRVIELSIDEARRLGDRYIGTEHLLLGLLREGEGIAAGVLLSLGADLDRMRHQVVHVRAEGSGEEG